LKRLRKLWVLIEMNKMRQLKFRAWYKGDNTDGIITPAVMCDVISFEKTSDNYDTLILHSKELIGSGKLAVARYRIYGNDSTCILMQFTGLHDCNGREIYEGDIVKLTQDLLDDLSFSEFTTYEAIGYVNYEAPEFIVKQIGESKLYFYDGMGINFSFEDLEIIGNIWEDKELLDTNTLTTPK
jgi:uncharacterized phage protein (TIGR01671 family)